MANPKHVHSQKQSTLNMMQNLLRVDSVTVTEGTRLKYVISSWFVRYVSVLAVLAFTGCQFSPDLRPGEGYVEVKGGRIWYRIIGEGKGTPLLLTHGGPGSTSRGFYQFAPLGADRPIILFD